jgi:hypothetical protein
VLYKGKHHVQFISMYVCTLKVAGDRHSILAQAKRGDIVDFGFLGSQERAPSIIEVEAEEAGARMLQESKERGQRSWRRAMTRHLVQTTRKGSQRQHFL